MDVTAEVTLITGIAATVAALLGYWLSQHLARRDRRSKIFAEALLTIHHYEELPYLIRRRPDGSAATRERLADKQSEVFAGLRYHQALLTIESPVVGDAYAALFAQTRRQGGPHRKEAWASALTSSDEEMSGTAYYPYDTEPELSHCIEAMRRELAPWAVLRRSATRRHLRELQAQRPQWQPPTWMQERERPAQVSAENPSG